MRIYMADDEELILKGEYEIVRECCPGAEIYTFTNGYELLDRAKEAPCDVAFLDISMPEIDGIKLAEKLRNITPNTNIIFLTAFDQHFREAMKLRASGYLLKPLNKSDVINELNNLRYQVDVEKHYKLKVICLGNFDVKLPSGVPVRFERSKSKEALAYLIHLRGSSCTVRELASVLFEDQPFDHKNQMYIQKIISSLMKSLKVYDADCVIEKNFNSISVNTSLLDCDYYQMIEENKKTRFERPEKYMEQYSWAMY